MFGTDDGFPPTRGFSYENEIIVMPTYKLLYTCTSAYIDFMIQVKTTGWVGIGFTPDQQGIMKGADMHIGRVLKDKIEIKDYKAIYNIGKPMEDTSINGTEDTQEIDGWEIEEGWTIVKFRKKRDTGDSKGDHPISATDPTYVIFAYQEDTDLFNYHGSNVAGRLITFLNRKTIFFKYN